MDIFRIEIINPKAEQLLKSLADLKLIRIKKEQTSPELSKILNKFRSQSENAPSLEEITEEVELVRKSRYEK